MKDIEKQLQRLPLQQLGANVKLVVGDDVCYVDGVAGKVLMEEIDYITTVIISAQHLSQILNGDESAVTLFTQGAVQIEGDMSVAFKLKDIFG